MNAGGISACGLVYHETGRLAAMWRLRTQPITVGVTTTPPRVVTSVSVGYVNLRRGGKGVKENMEQQRRDARRTAAESELRYHKSKCSNEPKLRNEHALRKQRRTVAVVPEVPEELARAGFA